MIYQSPAMDMKGKDHSSKVTAEAQLTELWLAVFTCSDCEYFTNLVRSLSCERATILRKRKRTCRPQMVFLLELMCLLKAEKSWSCSVFIASPSSFSMLCQICPEDSLWQVKLNRSPQWQKSDEKMKRVAGSSKQGAKILAQLVAISSLTGPVRMGTILTVLPRAFAMKGRCISMLCSSSSSSMSSMWNPSSSLRRSTTSTSTSSGPSGVLYSSMQVRAHPGKYLWCEGPKMKTRLISLGRVTYWYAQAAVGPLQQSPACGPISAFTRRATTSFFARPMYCASSALSSPAEQAENYGSWCTTRQRAGTVGIASALLIIAKASQLPPPYATAGKPARGEFKGTGVVLTANSLDSFIIIQTAPAMENQYKSPLRAASKSTCKPCKSVGKHSKYKQQSESKSLAARVKEISDRQPYKNLLNRLLRSENLSKFVREAEKYVELAEDLVAPYQSSNPENERSRREFQEYGRALLKDGSFIRYYCKLLEKEFHEDRRRIREFFFEKYRHEVCLREKMFHDYFKEELPANEDSNSFSFTKSKSKIKEKRDHHGRSQSKSKVKARTEVSFCVRENNKNAENLSVVELVESSSSVPTNESKSDSEIPRSEAKKGKIVHFNKEPAEEPVEEATCEEENYRSPFLKYNSKESEEEREFRLSGLVKQTPTRLKSSAKRKSNVVKFADEIKSNQKLREIYEQVLKEKEEREKLLKSNDKSTDNSSKPVLRSSVAPFSTIQFSEVKLRELTSLDKEGFTEIQREILAFYPTIHLKAHRRGIRIAAEKLEGHYKGYLIRKVVFTDVHHYLEPDYIGIVAKWADGERTEGLSECPFEPDERAEVVLFE